MTAAEQVERTGEAARNAAGQLGPAGDAAEKTFHHAHNDQSLLAALVGKLFDLIGRLIPDVSPTASLVGLLEWAILIGLGAGMVGLVLSLIGKARERSRLPAVEGQPRAGRPPASAGYEEARAGALRLASSDPREALRLLYGAVLAELGRRRGWRVVPGRTNWGFVRTLGPSTDQGRALAECTRLFERSVYGDRAAVADDVARVDALAGTVLAS
jgi:hypothetical protein